VVFISMEGIGIELIVALVSHPFSRSDTRMASDCGKRKYENTEARRCHEDRNRFADDNNANSTGCSLGDNSSSKAHKHRTVMTSLRMHRRR